MYIRAKEKHNKRSNKVYHAHKLCASVRTDKGPRQNTILHLGTLDLEQEHWKTLADRIEELLTGQQRLSPVSEKIEALAQHYAKRIIHGRMAEDYEYADSATDFQSVDVNSLASSEGKSIGPEHVGLEAMKHLGFFKIFEQLEFSKKHMDLASLLIVGRLIHPSSERELKRYAKEDSGLDELLKTDFSVIANNNSLYETSDLLFSKKDIIEQHLRHHSKKLLGLQESIILYDLTNTYFEGNTPYYEKAKHGRAKEKRSDCPLVTLGIALDESGFLKTSRIFEGNISEPIILMDMVRDIHNHSIEQELPFEKPTVVMDAGIATQKNLEELKAEEFSYIVVSRSKPKEIPDPEFVEIKKGVKVHSFTQDDEIYVHCVSEGKTQKEQAMIAKARAGIEKSLDHLRDGLSIKGRMKKYDKVLQRIGRLRNQYRRVSQAYDIHVKDNAKNAVQISWSFDETKLGKPYNGSYFLRTNRTDLNEARLWSIYVMLTIVEDAFRCLKDELGLRPNFHQKGDRIEGHIFITILAYHLLHYIRFKLNSIGLFHRWETIKSWLTTQRIQTTSLPKEGGGVIHVRHCSTPTLKQQEIYSALEIANEPFRKRKATT